MDTAAKLSSERQNDAAAVQTAETPENYRRSPELRKIKESAADIKYISATKCRNYKHRGVSNNGTRHTVPQNEENFPEPDKNSKIVKIREICSLANEQCNTKRKSTKNLRKHAEEPVERVRTRYNEKLKQRRKMSPTQIKTSNEH
jgi:hypothetical protein